MNVMLGARTSRPQRGDRHETFAGEIESFSRFALNADVDVRVPSRRRLPNFDTAPCWVGPPITVLVTQTVSLRAS